MSEMVERVARALHHAEYSADDYPFEREDEATKKLLRLLARAAIEAMREPTQAMVTEGYWCAQCIGDMCQMSAEEVYQAMIDDALSDAAPSAQAPIPSSP